MTSGESSPSWGHGSAATGSTSTPFNSIPKEKSIPSLPNNGVNSLARVGVKSII